MSYYAEDISLYMQKQIKVCPKFQNSLYHFKTISLLSNKVSASKTKKLQFAKKKKIET